MDLAQLEQLPTQLQGVDLWIWIAVAGLVVLVAIAVTLLLVRRRRRRRTLRHRYGAEYERTAQRAGSRRRADQELLAREQERAHYEVRELDAGERERLRARWEALQASFVDDPWAAVRGTDELLGEVAALKGYPPRGEDPLAGVGVDHPRALDRYRTSGQAVEDAGGAQADTEQLRRAVLASRDLFETLVGSERADAVGAGGRAAFRALVDEEEPAGSDELPERGRPRRTAGPDDAGEETTSSMPLYGPDGQPLWEHHADHGR